jgi:chemotaxis protein CheZ
MGEPRKVFRIEEKDTAPLANEPDDRLAPLRHAELMAQIAALRAVLAATNARLVGRPGPAAETARLASELTRIAGTIGTAKDERPASATRMVRELQAVVTSTEQATQRVLAAAEEIDQLANNLAAGMKGRLEQDTAHDIRDFVIRIFEACNFQDLAGQRIVKVMAMMKAIEDQIGHLLDEFNTAATAPRDGACLQGPRLDFDVGHASQADIDALFSRRR